MTVTFFIGFFFSATFIDIGCHFFLFFPFNQKHVNLILVNDQLLFHNRFNKFISQTHIRTEKGLDRIEQSKTVSVVGNAFARDVMLQEKKIF